MSHTGNLLDTDPGRDLLTKLCKVASLKLDRAMLPPTVDSDPDEDGVIRQVANPAYVNMPAGEMAAIIKLLSDNSVTLANIRRGDFGETIARAEENFPFPTSGAVQ